jgi:hypothetical protein
MRLIPQTQLQPPGGIAVRKLFTITALLGVMAAGLGVMTAPAQASGQPRWYRGRAAEVTISIERTQVGATNWSYVKWAGAEWARSGRIKIVFVAKCPSRLYCVKVYDGTWSTPVAGWATLNTDPRTNYIWYGSLHLNNRYLTSSATRRKTACHELGHTVGLGHRWSGTTCMRDGFGTMYGHPDNTDYLNILKIYARP